MKIFNKLVTLHPDDFFHVINMLYLDKVVTQDPDWIRTFEHVGQQDASTPIHPSDRDTLIRGLQFVDPSAIQYYLDTLTEDNDNEI